MAVVSKNASPALQEFSGREGFLGNDALSRVQAPAMVACPSTDAFRASHQPPYAETSIWWAKVPRPVSL